MVSGRAMSSKMWTTANTTNSTDRSLWTKSPGNSTAADQQIVVASNPLWLPQVSIEPGNTSAEQLRQNFDRGEKMTNIMYNTCWHLGNINLKCLILWWLEWLNCFITPLWFSQQPVVLPVHRVAPQGDQSQNFHLRKVSVLLALHDFSIFCIRVFPIRDLETFACD